jgi:chromosome segregation ATPase
VKQDLGHGQFLKWIDAEFGMKERSARNFMQVAERFGEKSANFADLPLSILYEIAAPSTSDEIVEKVLSGEIAATISAIKTEKKRADEAERAKQEVEHQLQLLQEDMATLQHERLQVREKTIKVEVENPQTQAELARLREEYAETKARLKQKTERIKVLSDEISKHESLNRQERYNEQVRFKWRQACDAFHQGINQGMTRMVSPLDAKLAFESDDWARLAEVLVTLKRATETLSGLRESVTSQFVDGSVEHHP